MIRAIKVNGRGYKALQDNTLKAIEVSTSNKNVDNHYKSLQAALLVLRLCETLDSRFADNEDMKQFGSTSFRISWAPTAKSAFPKWCWHHCCRAWRTTWIMVSAVHTTNAWRHW